MLKTKEEESWRSSGVPYFQFPLIKPDIGFPGYGFPVVFIRMFSASETRGPW